MTQRPIKFREVREFPNYLVSEDGAVISTNFNHSGKPREMRQYLDEDGYPYVFFTVNRKRYKRVIHRLVADLFLPPKPTDKHQVNHKNGKRGDNRSKNLEWVTSRENTLHGWRVNGRKFSDKAREVARAKMQAINKKKWKQGH